MELITAKLFTTRRHDDACDGRFFPGLARAVEGTVVSGDDGQCTSPEEVRRMRAAANEQLLIQSAIMT